MSPSAEGGVPPLFFLAAFVYMYACARVCICIYTDMFLCMYAEMYFYAFIHVLCLYMYMHRYMFVHVTGNSTYAKKYIYGHSFLLFFSCY